MPKLPIDLGRKMSEGPMAVESPKSDEKHYPSLYLDWENDYDLPDSGTMTVKFKKVSENKSKNRDGKKSFSVTLEVMEITDVKGKKAKGDDDVDPGDHLDKLKKEVEDENSDDEKEY